MKARILVVDDEKGIRDLLVYELGARGYDVSAVENGEEGLRKLREGRYQLVISDIQMPKLGGLEMLAAVKRLNPDLEVILVTGYGTVETAVSAMKNGAYDFVQKPFNVDELAVLIEKALERRELKAIIAVHEASEAVFRSIKLDAILPMTVRLTAQVLRADDASVMLLGGGKLEVAASFGLEDDPRRAAVLEWGERVAWRALEQRKPIVINGPLEEDERFAGIPSLRDIRSSIVFPLVIEGEALGVLNANRTRGEEPFQNADILHMIIFCSHAAQAVFNARTVQRLVEARERLAQSEKINTVGMLAAGIAHELNNPLTSILGFAQILASEARLSAEQKEDMECIVTQSQRCSLIIRELLQFSRKREPKAEPLSADDILDSALRLAKYDVNMTGVTVLRRPPGPPLVVLADRVQMQQVALNLIGNACHAMQSSAQKRLELGAESRDGRVLLRFKDSGCGIPEKNMPKVFEPFFTTKPMGKGTGLGLSICNEIVARHGGAIRVSSREGEGTTFTVELPEAPPKAAAGGNGGRPA